MSIQELLKEIGSFSHVKNLKQPMEVRVGNIVRPVNDEEVGLMQLMVHCIMTSFKGVSQKHVDVLIEDLFTLLEDREGLVEMFKKSTETMKMLGYLDLE